MKVLLINGSPNADGCTNAALNVIAQTLQGEQVETEIFHIGKTSIRGCTACGLCRAQKAGRCVFGGDPVNQALEKMEKADGLVIGSPVYFASPAGELMAFLDRMFYAGNCFQYKPACAVVSARRAGTVASYDVLNKYIAIKEMLQVPSCYWNMVHGMTKTDVMKDEEGVRNMRVLGQNMAWLLKVLKNAEQNVQVPRHEAMVRTNFIK